MPRGHKKSLDELVRQRKAERLRRRERHRELARAYAEHAQTRQHTVNLIRDVLVDLGMPRAEFQRRLFLKLMTKA